MARALECPACGARHRLDSLPDAPTFRCSQCGQVLKIPSWVSSAPGGPPPPARTGAPPQTAATPLEAAEAPPRRAAAPAAAAAVTATATAAAAASAQPVTTTQPPSRRPLPPADDGTSSMPAGAGGPELANGNGNGSGSGRRRRPQPAPAAPADAPKKRTRAHWYWRLVAWIVAVPLAFVLTAWPAYNFGFISKDDLLDVFVGTGTGRYVRIGIVTLVWAVVTAVLVQILVEGGRAWANKRRRNRSRAAATS